MRLLAWEVFYEGEPVAAGVGAGPGNDFRNIAVLELVRQRNHAGINFGPDAVISNFAVDTIGEINRCAALRQINNVAFRRHHKNLIGEEVFRDIAHKLVVVFAVGLPVEHLLTEKRKPLLELIADFAALFVLPVRRDSEFRRPVHFPCPNLHFQRTSGISENFDVQRLVKVAFALRDVVGVHSRNRFPQGGHNAERVITFRPRMDNDAQRGEVVQVRELNFLRLHFVINAV